MMSKTKKPGRGKGKGSAFEREIAKDISLWLTEGERNDCIWRTAGSGAKSTATGSDTMIGDLMAIRKEARKFFDEINVELKHYADLNFLELNNKGFKIFDWWGQVTKDSKRSGTKPLLIFRINHRGTWVAYKEEILTLFKDKQYIFNNNHILIYFEKTKESIYIEKYEDFFDKLDKEKLK